MSLALLRTNRNFRLHLGATTIANLGDGISTLALPWLATLLTRDPMMLGVLTMAGRLPWLLFALPAGVWTDRADRQRLIAGADAASAILTAGIVALVLSIPGLPAPQQSPGVLILTLAALTFLLGMAEVVRDNAAQTLLPAIVDQSDLEGANGLSWSAEQVMNQFIGPPLAGVLIALGVAVPFGINAVTFAISAALVALMVLPRPPLRGHTPFWASFAEGWRWIAAHRTVLQLAVLLALINAAYMAMTTVQILYAQEILGLDAPRYGLLLSFAATGGVIGGLISPLVARRLGPRRGLILALMIFGLHPLLMASSTGVAPVAAAMFVGAMGGMLWNVITVSYRQRVIPAGILGRVNSIYRFFGWGSMPFGAMAGGAMVKLAEGAAGRELALRLPFLFCAVLCLALAVYAVLRLDPDRS